MNKKINCPQCGKKDTWSTDNPYRPFCSRRCRLIDLGDWADEKHRIPGSKTYDRPANDDKDKA